MRSTFDLRLGSIAGWVSLIGIAAAFIVLPMAIAGQPPTIDTPLPDAVAYFRHPELAILTSFVGTLVGAVAVVGFVYALHGVLRTTDSPRSRVFADLALLLVVVTIPVYVVSSALGAALVSAATGDAATFGGLFRVYEILYNGAADILEGAWIGAFGIAMVRGPLPAWLGWLGIGLGLSRWLKAGIPFGLVIPGIDMVSGLLFLVWFIGAVVALTRVARRGLATSRVGDALASPLAG
jgi:uncharacterized membrane protein